MHEGKRNKIKRIDLQNNAGAGPGASLHALHAKPIHLYSMLSYNFANICIFFVAER